MKTLAKRKGFTIVELLIVIVVIAIIAVLSLVSYGGVQGRARDAQRVTDMKNISSALKVYGNSQKQFPAAAEAGGEVSYDTYGGDFIPALKTSGLVNSIPVDPINNSRNYYMYSTRVAGSGGCDASKGPYYVLQVVNLDKGDKKADNNPGFSCPSDDWTSRAWYTIGGFLYE